MARLLSPVRSGGSLGVSNVIPWLLRRWEKVRGDVVAIFVKR